MRTHTPWVFPAAVALAVAACGGSRESASPTPAASGPPVLEQASPAGSPGMISPGTAGPGMASPGASGAGVTAQLAPTQGNKVRGSVTFEPAADGVRVVAHIEGLTPGEHGFHLHEKGDCSAPDATSAGDHWNPTQQPHGAPDAAQHHSGDLGNITADANGMAHVEKVVRGLSLEGGQSVRGRAVIVHANPDDLKSQPSGNAGARQACGVVGETPVRRGES